MPQDSTLGGSIMAWNRSAFIRVSRLALLFAGLTALLLQLNTAFGQGIITGSIGGTVVDQTDAVIPNANITAVNDSTRSTLQGKSSAEGIFLISNVPVGSYT